MRMLGKLSTFKQEFLSFSLKEKLFLFTAMLSVFCICADYAVIRPVCNSVFIYTFGTEFFPFAWLATIPFNFLIISLYNRYLSRWGVWRTFVTIALLIVTSNLFCALFLKQYPHISFPFYLWKEVYIMLMLQQIWSIINATLEMNRAKYLYGLIFGVGGLGGVFGSMIPGFLAVKMGSESLLFFTLPLYTLLFMSFFLALKYSSEEIHTLKTKENPPFWEGMRLISSSKYLLFILSLVVFMQLSATIVDYQFHHYLEEQIIDKDLRTEFVGRVMGLVNSCTVVLQFFGSFLLVHFLGLRLAHLAIPLLLSCNVLFFLLFPLFGVITFSFVTIKAFDFSLFGVIREMLYIPLSVAEKFRAKAVIEVFASRSAKSLASLLILSLQYFAAKHLLNILTWSGLLLFVSWSLLVTLFFKKELQTNRNV